MRNFLGFLSVLFVSLFVSGAHAAGTQRIGANRELSSDWTVTGPETLTAQYTCNDHYNDNDNNGTCEGNIYTITLKKNDGTDTTVGQIYEKYADNFYTDEAAKSEISASGCGSASSCVKATIPSRIGYTFAGWYTAKSGGDKIIDASGYVAASSDSGIVSLATKFTNNDGTLYAHWTANTNTKYVVNHYTKELGKNTYKLARTEERTGTTGAEVTLVERTKPIDGFTYSQGFAGTATNGTTKPTSGAVTTTTILAEGTRVIDLYYTRNSYTMTIDKNGGSGTLTVKLTTKTGTENVTFSCEYEATFTLPTWSNASGTENNLAKSNNVFTGWDATSSTVTCNSAKTIKAKWTQPTCFAGTGVSSSKLNGVYDNAPVCSRSSKAGYYCSSATQTGSAGATSLTVECTAAGNGYYATAGASAQTQCPIGSYSEATSASTKCTPCPGGRTTSEKGTKYNATATTACSATCANNANAATWEDPTWFEGSVANLCKIATCANKYVRTGSTAQEKSYVCSACTCTPGNNVASCKPLSTNSSNQCVYTITCDDGYNTSEANQNNEVAGVASYTSAACTGNTINLTWTSKYGTAPTTPKSCTYGGNFSIPAAIDVYGHAFGGWSVNNKTLDPARFTAQCNHNTLGKYSGTADISAIWDNTVYTLPLYDGQGFENQGKIYFVSGGGFYLDAALTQQIQRNNCNSSNPDNPCTGHKVTKPTRTGYTFGGYQLSTSNADIIDESGNLVSSVTYDFAIPDGTQLNAVWAAKCNKITLNKNGGKGGPDALYKKSGSTEWFTDSNCSTANKVTTLPEKPTKTNATFNGYFEQQ